MPEQHVRIVGRSEQDAGLFAGLEELRVMRATPFDRFAVREVADRAPAPVTGRFDVCIEIGPPPRLA